MLRNSQETANLVTFTEESLMENLIFWQYYKHHRQSERREN